MSVHEETELKWNISVYYKSSQRLMPCEALNKECNVQLVPEVLEHKDFILFFWDSFSITALVGHAVFAREVTAF